MSLARRCGLAALAAVMVALWQPPAAHAQQPFRRRPLRPPSPTTSPYLNLFRRDRSTAFNYYSLVRPELQIRAGLRQQAAAINQLNRQLQQATANGGAGVASLRPTGHATTFLNYSHYYQGLSGGSAGAGFGRR